MRRGALLSLLALLALPAPAAAQAEPVLGIEGLYGEYGSGWGKVRPASLYNGGVPSGHITDITWRDWGQPVAFGRGKVWQYKPRGGYYRRRVAIQLKPSRLGECPGAEGQPAYTRMIARARTRPGGPWGDWFPWTLDLCDLDAEPAKCPRVAFDERGDHGARAITAWDTDCATAQAVARDSRRVRYRRGFRSYRFHALGFVCNGYSFTGPRRRIFFTCYDDTAVVGFTRF